MNGLGERFLGHDAVFYPKSLMVQHQLQLQAYCLEVDQLKGKLAFYCHTNEMLQTELSVARKLNEELSRALPQVDVSCEQEDEVMSSDGLKSIESEILQLSTDIDLCSEDLKDLEFDDEDSSYEMETNSDVNVLDEKISVLSQYVREYNDHSNCDIHVCDNSRVLSDDGSVPTFPRDRKSVV